MALLLDGELSSMEDLQAQAAQRIHVQLMNGLEREARADRQPRS
jgi:hypothetical protein